MHQLMMNITDAVRIESQMVNVISERKTGRFRFESKVSETKKALQCLVGQVVRA